MAKERKRVASFGFIGGPLQGKTAILKEDVRVYYLFKLCPDHSFGDFEECYEENCTTGAKRATYKRTGDEACFRFVGWERGTAPRVPRSQFACNVQSGWLD